MAIGVFDSGVGGLTVHRELTRRFPDRDFVYLADQANAPYGGRGGEEIVELTRAGCERLFEAGANVIVLACNTASAIALRRLQQTWVPEARARHGRPINVLGIIVPTIEAATGLPWTYERTAVDDKIEAIDITGVFCTAATASYRGHQMQINQRARELALFPTEEAVDDRLHLLAHVIEPLGVLEQAALDEHVARAPVALLRDHRRVLQLVGFDLPHAHQELPEAIGRGADAVQWGLALGSWTAGRSLSRRSGGVGAAHPKPRGRPRQLRAADSSA